MSELIKSPHESSSKSHVFWDCLYLEKREVTDSYISKVKAALIMYEQMLNKTTAFTKPVDRILDGVKNLAVSRKPPVSKRHDSV